MQPFLKDLPRIARTAARHCSADIALMGHIRGEPHPIAFVEDGREHAHVRRMGTAAEIGMVRDKRIALLDLGYPVGLQDCRCTSWKGSHVKRQYHMLRDDLAVDIQNRATCVLGFSDDRRVAGAKQRVLHLLDDAGQARLNDLERNGINAVHAALAVRWNVCAYW